MNDDKRLPQTIVHLGTSAEAKLARTETGRAVLHSSQLIVDSVKYEAGYPDRVWLGTTRTAVLTPKRMTLRCEMSDEVLAIMEKAFAEKDAPTLAAMAVKLMDAFRGGANFCPFVLEKTDGV